MIFDCATGLRLDDYEHNLDSERRERVTGGQRRETTAEQWRAVRLALEKFCAMGAYALMTPVSRALPPFEIQWNPSWLDRRRMNAVTNFARDGTITIGLRTDRTAAEIHRSMLHELQHVADAPLILSHRLSEATYEQRAQDTAARLSRW